MNSIQLLSRAIIQARDDKSFWDKYKWYIIGGVIAIPIQLVMLWFYLRWRKNKKVSMRIMRETPEQHGSSEV
ncbi:hypothetical protein DL98DRAFT_597833 [Cadophora sp. DSE1049]|nr:hypothetical protein DL98DRAFT_597833 [Cadophora sp. DSE1049]